MSLRRIFFSSSSGSLMSKNALAYIQERKLNASLEICYNNYATEYKELQKLHHFCTEKTNKPVSLAYTVEALQTMGKSKITTT